MAKVKVSIVNQNTLKLEVNGQKGDIIDLREIQNIDTTFIKKKIDETQKNEIDKLVEKEKEKIRTDFNLKFVSKEKDLLKNNTDLNAKYIALKSNVEMRIEKALLEQKNKIRDLEKDREFDKKLYQEQLRHQKEAEAKNILLAEERIKKQFQNKENDLKAELSQLKLSKSKTQIKTLGEELEKWCNEEFLQYQVSGFQNCKWYKDNISVKDENDSKGTKADYIFEVYSDLTFKHKLTSVCCEMKNESPLSQNKNKNADYYKKLDKDRIKKGCEYALLISELEWNPENDAPIKRVLEYENMYMVRPQYFVSFLSIVQTLATKYQKLINFKTKEDFKFEETQKVLDEFEDFKRKYFTKPIEQFGKEIISLKKHADIAKTANDKIVSILENSIQEKLNTIKEKIEKFNMKKITKKIEKLN